MAPACENRQPVEPADSSDPLPSWSSRNIVSLGDLPMMQTAPASLRSSPRASPRSSLRSSLRCPQTPRPSRTVRFELEEEGSEDSDVESLDSFESWALPKVGRGVYPNRLLHERHVKSMNAFLEEVKRSPLQWRCQVAASDIGKRLQARRLNQPLDESLTRTESAPVLGSANRARQVQPSGTSHFDLVAARAKRPQPVPIPFLMPKA
ncbi:unnamed protein product [Effrenium voratum]|uniref:Uncharacterized protein n=1 Tax=Effrenium voratum TaxID=2562239 RepID=A0AA36MLS2_9DINO|nr:unnamed protein product [Effrenium voratum]